MKAAILLLAIASALGCISLQRTALPDLVLQAGQTLAEQKSADEARFYLVKDPHLTLLRKTDDHDPTGYFVLGKGWETEYMAWFPDEGILIRVGSIEDLEFFEKKVPTIIKKIGVLPVGGPDVSPAAGARSGQL